MNKYRRLNESELNELLKNDEEINCNLKSRCMFLPNNVFPDPENPDINIIN